MTEARAEMSTIAAQLAQAYPAANERNGIAVVTLRDEVSWRSRQMLWALAGAAFCMLLIACTNLASLLLSRALGRQRELAVRTALGAGRERLVRQMLTENMVIAGLGGVLGSSAAVLAVPLVARLVPTTLPIPESPGVDARLLDRCDRRDPGDGPGVRRAPGAEGRRHRDPGRTARGLAQRNEPRHRTAALGAGRRGGLHLAGPAGVRGAPRAVAVAGAGRQSGLRQHRCADLAHRAARCRSTTRPACASGSISRSSATSAACPASRRPRTSAFCRWSCAAASGPITVDGRAEDPNNAHTASLRLVTAGFFETLGIPRLAGRDIQDGDVQGAPRVAIVSRSFADRHWPGQDALGRRVSLAVRRPDRRRRRRRREGAGPGARQRAAGLHVVGAGAGRRPGVLRAEGSGDSDRGRTDWRWFPRCGRPWPAPIRRCRCPTSGRCPRWSKTIRRRDRCRCGCSRRSRRWRSRWRPRGCTACWRSRCRREPGRSACAWPWGRHARASCGW